MSPEEIRAMSVTHVNTVKNYNKHLPVPGSVNCPRMGSMDRRVECTTCINDNKDCPGHFGKIELPSPFYYPGFIKETMAVLRTVCTFCCRILVEDDDFKVVAVMDVKDETFSATDRTFKKITDIARSKRKCPHCEMTQPNFTQDGPNIKWDWPADFAVELANMGMWSTCGRPFNAGDALSILSNVPDEDYAKMGLDITHSHPKWAVMTVMPVVPIAVRPPIMASEGSNTRGQDDLTFILKRIVQTNHEIREAMEKSGLHKNESFISKCGSTLPKHSKKKRKKKGEGHPEEPVLTKEELLARNRHEWGNPQPVADVLASMDTYIQPDGDFVALMWEKMPKLMEKLQRLLVAFVNNEGKLVPQMKQRSGTPMKTLINRLNAKGGRIRGHLMGKRMDFSGRSVITPGANLDVTEVGVPGEMAAILTIPEVVNSRNRSLLQDAVRKGPRALNGANRILCPDGRVIYLEYLESRAKLVLELGWIVERHLRDGDPILFNRQPSLHRMSLMCFSARILPDSHAFQLNLCCTTAFNADFDGDEMNIHVCQNIRALAESRRLLGVQHHIISPQTNAPIISLVQNGLLGSYLMTSKDVFFTREEMCFYASSIRYLSKRLAAKPYSFLPPPAILIPKPLWTGKQLYSLLFPQGLSVSFKWSDAGSDYAGPKVFHPEEPIVLVRDGELLAGRLTKKAVGTSANNIVSVLAHDLGPLAAVEFLSDAGRLMNNYLERRGFSVGIEDCRVSEGTRDKIKDILRDTDKVHAVLDQFQGVKRYMHQEEKGQVEGRVQEMIGQIIQRAAAHAFAEASGSAQQRPKGSTKKRGRPEKDGIATPKKSRKIPSNAMKSATPVNPVGSNAMKSATPVNPVGSNAMKSATPVNPVGSSAMMDMINSGAKGKAINFTNLTVAVGQQIIEGQRPQPGPTGRTLPCFSKTNRHPMTQGYIGQSYVEGLKPFAMFCHYMGGREGLVDTAVKTANTGYMQRQLVKAFEACILTANKTVMEENRTIVQFRYGEDGMDPMCVERCPFEWITYSNAQLKNLARLNDEAPIHGVWYRMMVTTRDSTRALFMTILFPEPPSQVVLPVHLRRILRDRYGRQSFKATKSTKDKKALSLKQAFSAIRDLCIWVREVMGHEGTAALRLSILCELAPRHLVSYGLTTEDVLELVAKIKDDYLLSMAQTGEMCGIVAAQSVGEPTTQMTLNTFHLAGQGSKKLNFGVPRFLEIVNMSPSPATPYMSLALKESSYETARKVCQAIVAVPLDTITNDPFVVRDPALTGEEGPTTTIRNHLPVMDQAAMVFGREIDGQIVGVWEPSPYVICLELKKERMREKELTPLMVARAIEAAFCGVPMSIIYSEVNSPLWLVRVRPWNMDSEVDVRAFPAKLMTRVSLGGIKGISFAEPCEVKVPTINEVTGEIEELKEWRVDAQGSSFDPSKGIKSSSFLACAQIPMVDWCRSTTNHILECSTVLGISACRSLILKELYAVLTADGSYVDQRHIQLLADALTFRGYPMTTTRHGQNKTDKGPLIRASFEGTADMLHHAAYFGEKDHMLGFTQNLMLGQIPPIGSGVFGVQRHDNKGSLLGAKSGMEVHELMSKLTAIEPKRKERIDKETGVVVGSHPCAKPRQNPEEVDSAKPHRRVRFRAPIPESEMLVGDLDALIDHVHDPTNPTGYDEPELNEPPEVQDSAAMRQGAYAALGPRLKHQTVSTLPVQPRFFDGDGVGVFGPVLLGLHQAGGDPESDREVRVQLYREYIEQLRHSDYEYPDKTDDIDMSGVTGVLETAIKEDFDEGSAKGEAPLNLFEEFETKKSSKERPPSSTVDPLGSSLDLVDLPGLPGASKKGPKTFRPSSPHLDLV
jgi:DNA-directed RNA polymerase beta' subunit